MKETVTEQITRVGRRIEQDSFTIIDHEAGPHGYDPRQWVIVRRMIHASTDFELNGLARLHPEAVSAGIAAILAGRSLVADVEMICVSLSRPRLDHFGIEAHQFIGDPDVIAQAQAQAQAQDNSTRAVQAMRKAHGRGLLEGGILAVGNAPTALLEIIRLMREEGVRPSLVGGLGVGTVTRPGLGLAVGGPAINPGSRGAASPTTCARQWVPCSMTLGWRSASPSPAERQSPRRP